MMLRTVLDPSSDAEWKVGAALVAGEAGALRFVRSDQMQMPQIQTAACKFFGAVVGNKPKILKSKRLNSESNTRWA